MFKKLEERVNILIRSIENIKGYKSNFEMKTIMSEMKNMYWMG